MGEAKSGLRWLLNSDSSFFLEFSETIDPCFATNDISRDDSQHGECANNRAELSHQPTRVRERGMRRSDVSGCKSMLQAQRFLNVHAAVSTRLYTICSI
jgi:transposase-like protein